MEVLRAVILLLLGWSSLSVTSSPLCGDRGSVEVKEGRRGSDGWLVAKGGTRFPPGCYWTSPLNVTSGCPGKTKPCLWKCCKEGETMDMTNTCRESNNTLLRNYQPPPRGTFNTSTFDLIHGFPCASNQTFHIEATSSHTFNLLQNGSLFVDHPEEPESFLAGHFCQEILEHNGNAHIEWLGGCFDAEDPLVKELPRIKFIINLIAIIISLPFLVATLVVYAVIPELRNLHGKCLMSHVASLIVAFVCLALMQRGLEFLPKGACIAAGMIAYFSFLASFLWLNVMCFDIWWTFSGYRGRLGPKDPRDRLKFIYYSCYAWGAALVLLCVCAAMQFSDKLPDNYLRPEFGEFSCWFHDDAARWAYFIWPVGVLIVLNIVFFTLTAHSIWKIKKQTAVLTECKESQRNSHTAISELRFKLYLKLFIVMGVMWIMEIISWAVGGPDYLWWITDLANLLVGIPIFIIFVWKTKVKKLFFEKLHIKVGSSVETSGIELT